MHRLILRPAPLVSERRLTAGITRRAAYHTCTAKHAVRRSVPRKGSPKGAGGRDKITLLNQIVLAKRTRNLKLVHKARGVKMGTIRRAKADMVEQIQFECRATDTTAESITAGRFVHLLLRYMQNVSYIVIIPASRRK